MNNTQQPDEKLITKASLFCSILLFVLGVLLYFLPSINDEGLTSLVENLATPFALALIFFIIEDVKKKKKNDTAQENNISEDNTEGE
jgi:hypothetical protein